MIPGPNGAKVYPIPSIPRDHLKTPYMKELEHAYKEKIEVLIYRGTLAELSRKFHISEATVQVWRNLLHLYWREAHLPKCEGCTWRDRACHPHRLITIRRCRVLAMCGQRELAEIKDRSVMGPERIHFL